MRKTLLTLAVVTTLVVPGEPVRAATVAGYDALFLLDGSGSVTEAGFNLAKDFALLVAENELDPSTTDNRVAFMILTDATTTHYRFGDPQDTAAFTTLVDAVTFPSGSASGLRNALDDAVSLFEAAPVIPGARTRHLFFPTDGLPTSSSFASNPCEVTTTAEGIAAAATRDALANAQVTIQVLGIGPGFSPTHVECLVDDPDTAIFSLGDEAALDYFAVNGALPPTPVPLPGAPPLLGAGGLPGGASCAASAAGGSPCPGTSAAFAPSSGTMATPSLHLT